MAFRSNLNKKLYEIFFGTEEEKLLYNLRYGIAKSFGKIAYRCWGKISAEDKGNVILRSKFVQGRNLVYSESDVPSQTGHLLLLEYQPRETIELTELAKSAFATPKPVINLDEKANEFIYGLYKRGRHLDFKEYVKKSGLSLEKTLVKMGYDKKIYGILKNELESMKTKMEQQKKIQSPQIRQAKHEKSYAVRYGVFLVFTLLIIGLASVFTSPSLSGLATTTLSSNPLVWLLVLLVALLLVLFLH